MRLLLYVIGVLLGSVAGFTFGYSVCKHKFSKPMVTASAPTTGTGSPLPVFIENISSQKNNANVTVVSPVDATINGQSTLVIPPNQQCIITSKDGNYEAYCKGSLK